MPGLHKFEKNILGLSKTRNVDELHLEWVAVGYEKTDGNDVRCVCNRWIKYVYYFYNHVTNRTIAVGTACADKLKEIIGRNGKARSVVNLCDLGLKPGIYTEITDLEAYSEEIRRQICALLRVHLGRCDAFELVDFIENPKLLLNDAGLIAFARERLEQFKARRKAQQEREQAERVAAQLEREREEARERQRIQDLRVKEYFAEIEDMKRRWSLRDRVLLTTDELPLEEEFRDANETFKRWNDRPLMLLSLELLEEERQYQLERERARELYEQRLREAEERERIRKQQEEAGQKAMEATLERIRRESRERRQQEQLARQEQSRKYNQLLKRSGLGKK